MTERLLLLPGWGLDSEVLQPLVAALSPFLHVELQSLPQLASGDVEAWLDDLDARLPQDCWLAGWSLGGMLATALAARRGQRCRGLISLASNACFVSRENWAPAMAVETFSAFRAGCAQDAAATLKRFAMLCAQGGADARGLGRRLQQAAPVHEYLLPGLDLLAALDTREAMANFVGPQLHLLAEQDALVPAAVSEALLALLPTGEVDVLEGCGHAFVLEQADKLATLMLGFIREADDD